MNLDIEADFWKNQFVHLLHKNMVRINAKPLTMNNAQEAFDRFALAHPEYKVEIQNSSSYYTWETFVTPGIKLRLFIQNSVKATLLQRNAGDLIKIADTKFPYDPFPEISEFLQNKNGLQIELEHMLEESARKQRKLKLAGEFIKAQLKVKYQGNNQIIWKLEPDVNSQYYTLTITWGNQEQKLKLTPENFLSQLNSI